VVATTHKGSLACAASGAGQGQVAPRGCKTHGLDNGRLDLDLAYLGTSGTWKHCPESKALAAVRRDQRNGRQRIAQRRPKQCNMGGDWESAKEETRATEEGRKTKRIDVRNTAVFAVFLLLLLLQKSCPFACCSPRIW
jgi:hypothetical protein